jgi:small conductance mechanosensitive channel
MEYYLDYLVGLVELYGPRLVYSIIILFVGFKIVKAITNTIGKTMDKKQIDSSLKPFLLGIIGVLLKALVIISVFGTLGVEMVSFAAILGGASLAIGMALSGNLSNFAGGVIILIFKPFKIGDLIEAQGHTGFVNSIQIFSTFLKTTDNKTIIIPNGGLSTGSMVNYSTEETRRVDWTVGCGYGDDLKKVKETLQGLIDADSRILKSPASFIAVSELGDSSVNFTVRGWVNSSDYWGVFFDMNENVYNEFNKQGINIPFPQMDVHLDK